MLKHRNSFAAMISIFVLLSAMGGCNRSNSTAEPPAVSPATSERLPPIEVVVVDDDALANAIEREWSAAGGEPLTVKRMQAADLKRRQAWTADVIVYPFSWMGDLVSRRIIRPLERATGFSPDSTDQKEALEVGDFFERTRNSEMTWGKKTYAASLGSPQFVLLYRKEVFDELSLTVPTTWAEYDRVVTRIEEQSATVREVLQVSDEQTLTAAPLGVGWAGKTFLARAAAYARNRSQDSCLFSIQSFEPQIDQAPFVRALDELRSIHQSATGSTPYSIAADLAAGKLAMAITWPEAARSTDSTRESESNSNKPTFGVASLPGSRDFFDRRSGEWQSRSPEESSCVPLIGASGRCASIGRRTPDANRAYDFVTWLASRDNGLRIASRSRDTTISRFSQSEHLSTTLPPAYSKIAGDLANVIQSDQSRDLKLSVIRVPDHERYMQALDTTIREALSSSESSQSILKKVATSWAGITEEIGSQKQVSAYGRALGIDP